MGDPEPLNLCLGCHHKQFTKQVKIVNDDKTTTTKTITFLETEMKQAMQETVQQYIDVATKAGYTPKLQRVETPFLDHDTPDPGGVKPIEKLSRVAA